ncbi:gap junction delta-3 protein-like [Pseudoliparis swirei]|uniref:gap junction delta-3 protein-like n=1 Tax=Pseudoliparis swirei TaxID=2059687 RepID=UPI0024BD6B2C|nr:gap junction delta-3 protein-like [Pseudoliparis swirei]
MSEWGFLGGLFDSLQAHSTMLGRFWLLLMLVFRILILGTVASDLFDDEQEEFACNTLQPGCKQVCYDMAFPISQYRFWVFHIVLIATPSLVFLMYVMHHDNKRDARSKIRRNSRRVYREDLHLRRMYVVNVAFRIFAELGFLAGQWRLYGFKVEAQFPCSRFPCPYTVDCFTSRPAEKTVFLCFYFTVGVISAISSCAELLYSSFKWFCVSRLPLAPESSCVCHNLLNIKHEEVQEEEEEEKPRGRTASEPGNTRPKGGSVRSGASRKVSGVGHKPRGGKYVSTRTFMV